MDKCVGHYAYIKLILPVFHIGYFKQTITMLQDICKTCAGILLSEEDKRLYLKKFRRPNLENLRRQRLAKEVNSVCRKVVRCPHCDAVNGVVKKVSGMKIVHEKFRAKAAAEARDQFEATFQTAIQEQPEIKTHLSKAQDDLNPLKVLALFKRISAIVGLAAHTLLLRFDT